MREIYRLLSLLAGLKAATKGPGPLARFFVRRTVHREVAQAMRKVGV